ncbi:MAG: hypothetical protein ACO3XO_10625, partial [Bdellovibrionota bacterium]
ISHLSEDSVASAFSEIREYAQGCMFRDCSHVKEATCAVREGVASGEIAAWRYQSYLQVLEEVREANKW